MPKGCLVLLAGVVMALVLPAAAQKASNWRVYRLADGLPESACVSVTIAPQGKVLTKHLNLPQITELDGYSLNIIPAATEPAGGRIYGSPGGQLWTVIPSGLEEFKEGGWVVHPVPEIAADFHEGQARTIDPIPICRSNRASSFFCSPTV